jgi:hypothetical protein
MNKFGWRLICAGAFTVLAAGIPATSAAQAAQLSPGPARAAAPGRPLVGLWNLRDGPMLSGPNARAAGLSAAASGVEGQLFGATALSPASAWAVGFTCVPRCASGPVLPRTLIRRWNGTAWSTVPSPSPGADWNYLFSVSATSAKNAWAVGYRSLHPGPSTVISGTLILHWNGTTWSRIRSPNPSREFNVLDGVSAVSATNAWAVGYEQTKADGFQPLILHWNGKTWSRVPSPKVSKFTAALAAVSATSAKNAWAVGKFINGTGVIVDTLILHWNGRTWHKVPSPSPSQVGSVLLGVRALSANRAWAAGGYCVSACGFSSEVDHNLVLRWTGKTWSIVPSPKRGLLTGISAISARSAWAVGRYCVARCNKNAEVDHAVILRWNGHAWASTPSPHPNSTEVLGVADASAASAWAVGDSGSSFVFHPLILHWNGRAWSAM